MPREQLDLVLGHLRRVTGPVAEEELTDAQLLERYVAGRDEEAFATLVRRHGRLVRSVCRHVLHHEEDTGDAFQATFLVFACKAASIQKTNSVASWLYGVAYRTAMNARRARTRRSKEQVEVRGCSPEGPCTEAALREVQTILDDEVKNLAEKYRAPFVLCCLEGKSRAEAARELGWKEGTVFSRLARARKELQQRLSRRGVVLTAALCAIELSRTGVTAAVRPALLNCTIKAALSFAADKTAAADLMSAEVTTLAKGVLQNMCTSKLKIATALLLTAGLLTGTALLTRHALAAKPAAIQPQTVAPMVPDDKKGPAAPRAAAPKADEAEALVFSGTVLGSDGRPFAGAKVFLWTSAIKKPADMPVLTATEADGRFRITVAKADLERRAKVVVRASDHGPDWVELAKVGKDRQLTLRLVKDDVPIHGRLLDLEGQPITGATVHVTYLEKRVEAGDLTPWIETKRQWARGNYIFGVEMMGLAASALDEATSVTTGKDGSFRLTGFGRERVVHLSIRGTTIESSDAEVITRAGPVAGLPAKSYAATFRHPIGPSKPLVGTVRDKRTGKPLAGIKVAGTSSPGGTIGATVRADAVTDENGKFSLHGVGKCEQYWIAAGGASYFNSTKLAVADTTGLGPLTVDFDLERGIVVHGRVTDKVTGKPVKGSVSCLALDTNPNLKDFTELGKLQVLVDRHGDIAADGSFTAIAVPGPGLLCVQAEEADHYCAAEIEGWDGFLLRAAPGGRHPSQFHAVVSMGPTEKDPKSCCCDIALQPGQTRTGTVVGPDGEPLAGACVAGLTPVPHFRPPSISATEPVKEPGLKTADFIVLGLSPRKGRTLVFFHPEKKLGKLQPVRGDETGALTVRLGPLGAVTGRVLDAEGRPWAGLTVRVELTRLITAYKDLPWELLQNLGPTMELKTTTDRDGKFHLDGLLPGLKYNLVVSEGELKPGVTIAYYQEDLPIESGKTTNLGNLKSKVDKEGTDKKR
jgi:RNA polymerase sigma factor (sigma-70 family)